MKYYAIGAFNVTDPSWVNEYIAEVTGIVHDFGGRFLTRTTSVECIEGERPAPQVLVLVEWPDRESAQHFYQSEAYSPFLKKRLAGSDGQFLLAPAEDLAKAGQS